MDPRADASLAARGLATSVVSHSDSLVSSPDIDYAAKFRGALVGSAIGDALGAPVEDSSPEEIAAMFGVVTDYRIDGYGTVDGSITDDTQMALCIATSLVEHGHLDADDVADRFLAWLPIGRGVGASTMQSLLAMRRGIPWWEAAEDSAGNGAAMRVAPIGLFHPADTAALAGDAALSAVITHANGMAAASAIAQAFAIAHLLHVEPGDFDAARLLSDMRRLVEEALPAMPDEADRLVGLLFEMGDRLDDTPEELFAYTNNGAYVLESLPAAWWCFLRSPEDPEQVLVTAVNGGYDADTVAALAGALAGAYLGDEALPNRWLTGLEYVDGIIGVADKLWRMSRLPGDPAQPRYLDDASLTAVGLFCPIEIDGAEYPTITHAYLALRTDDEATRRRIRFAPTPQDARRHSAGAPLVPGQDAAGLLRTLLDAALTAGTPGSERLHRPDQLAWPDAPPLPWASDLATADGLSWPLTGELDALDVRALLEERLTGMS